MRRGRAGAGLGIVCVEPEPPHMAPNALFSSALSFCRKQGPESFFETNLLEEQPHIYLL